MGRLLLLVVALSATLGASTQPPADPDALLQEAERLAWLKVWTRAAPLYAEAARLFAVRGDRRNALFAEINNLRGQLPTLPIADVSQRLADYLDDPLVQHDDRLRLRCLAIKGETDMDLDPDLAAQSWHEAFDLANTLGERAWANRADGELGIASLLQGDINSGVVHLRRALTVAESNGDTPSRVRWLSVFGQGYIQMGRAEQALDFYDRALKTASTVDELQFPLMTYLGKGQALATLGRFPEAEEVLSQALARAEHLGALGYQAEITSNLASIAYRRKQSDRALDLYAQAMALARQVGANRIRAEIALDLGKSQLATNKTADAERTFAEGVALARDLREPMLTPKLLAQLANVQSAQGRYADAANLLDEASDMLEGLLGKISSPWLRSRLIGVMDEVFVARIRLAGSHTNNPNQLFTVLEQARGRSLLELLAARPLADVKKSPEFRAGEKQIAALQAKLYRTTSRDERKRLLEQIFLTEERLAPASTELFEKTQLGSPHKPATLQDLQHALRDDEVFLEFAVAEPESFCVVATRGAVRLVHLPAKSAVQRDVDDLLRAVRDDEEPREQVRRVGAALLGRISEFSSKHRVIVSLDGALHLLPFELLSDASGKSLLESHVVSYIPSGSVLAIIRNRPSQAPPRRMALSVSASPVDEKGSQVASPSAAPAPFGSISRSVYDLDGGTLAPLPSANEEARLVAAILGGDQASTVLTDDAATELHVKRQPLQDYQVLHFAAHGILSTKFPERSALVLRAGGGEDGLLQAREILALRLKAQLVTLSACDTGSGNVFGQEGVSSLVRPFLAAGARAVVANLWAVDDTFSLAMMKEFYQQLAAGVDKGEALRQAKLNMVHRFGPEATPKLWSGLLMYGDSVGRIASARTPAK